MKAGELAVALRVPEATIRAKARFIEKALSANAPEHKGRLKSARARRIESSAR
jgi:hypothetical protein